MEEYLERRAASLHVDPSLLGTSNDGSASAMAPEHPLPVHRAAKGSAEEREARKAIARIDRQLERLAVREAELNAAALDAGQDYERLAEVSAELSQLAAERDELELEWLEVAERLE